MTWQRTTTRETPGAVASRVPAWSGPHGPTALALKRGDPSVPLLDRVKRESPAQGDREGATPRIRCPACEWVPAGDSRWMCVSHGAPEFFDHGCGTAWHTFDTRGRCPGCGHIWQWTACLQCGTWSPHEDWYESGDDAGD
ncbi:MAG: hypothetical protein R2752_08380 [Vicinamibacterales bacterium]